MNRDNFFQTCWLVMQSRNPRLRKQALEIELELAGLETRSLPEKKFPTIEGSVIVGEEQIEVA